MSYMRVISTLATREEKCGRTGASEDVAMRRIDGRSRRGATDAHAREKRGRVAKSVAIAGGE